MPNNDVILTFIKSIDERTKRIEANQDLTYSRLDGRLRRVEGYQGRQKTIMATIATLVSGVATIGAWVFDHMSKGGPHQ